MGGEYYICTNWKSDCKKKGKASIPNRNNVSVENKQPESQQEKEDDLLVIKCDNLN